MLQHRSICGLGGVKISGLKGGQARGSEPNGELRPAGFKENLVSL